MGALDSADAVAFAALLRACRRSADFSQQELAERSGMSIRAIGNLERGRIRWPHPDTVRRLADALDLPGQTRARFIAAAGRRVAGASSGEAGAVLPDQLAWVHGARVVPRQLPGPAQQFTGRRSELATLTSVLDRASSGTPTATAISAIGGMAGAGKTALAVHWAHQVAHRFPDGQLFINLRGYDSSSPPVPATAAMRGLVEAFGVAPEWMPRSAEGLTGLYRSLLAGLRVLVIFDNARDAAQVRPLLPGGPASFTVITSRSRLTGLAARDGATQITLTAMSDTEARDLLAGKLGADRIAEDDQAAQAIADGCGRLPLALCITAARAMMRPDLSLAQIAASLSTARSGLDGLAVAGDREADVRASFSWSYQSLTSAARRMFRLLGLHPGPELSAEAATSLAGVPPGQAARLLAGLTESSLLSVVRGRFVLHDLLRVYAANLVATHDSDATRHAAIRRMLDHYLITAAAAAQLCDGTRLPTEPPPQAPGVRPEELTTAGPALDWLTREYAVLLRLVELADATGFDTHAWQLPRTLRNLFDWRAQWADWERTHRIAARAAARLGDRRALALTHLAWAKCDIYQNRREPAEQHLHDALGLFRELADHTGQARTLIQFGVAASTMGHYRQAVSWAQRAHALYTEHGDLEGQAGSLANLGLYHYHLGDFALARDLLARAREMFTTLGHREGQAVAANSLGLACRSLGDCQQAIAQHREAVSLLAGLGETAHQAECLNNLADACRADGQITEAIQACGQALAILAELHHPDASRTRAKLENLQADMDARSARSGRAGISTST